LPVERSLSFYIIHGARRRHPSVPRNLRLLGEARKRRDGKNRQHAFHLSSPLLIGRIKIRLSHNYSMR
jgi:hypothetical protein